MRTYSLVGLKARLCVARILNVFLDNFHVNARSNSNRLYCGHWDQYATGFGKKNCLDCLVVLRKKCKMWWVSVAVLRF